MCDFDPSIESESNYKCCNRKKYRVDDHHFGTTVCVLDIRSLARMLLKKEGQIPRAEPREAMAVEHS